MKLRDGEVVLHELRAEKNAPVVWLFTRLCGGGALLALVGVVALAVGAPIVLEPDSLLTAYFYAALFLLLVAALFAPLLLLLLSYAIKLCRTFRYFITNERCVFVGGILRYRERSVGYHKITDVERGQNLIERALGLCSVRLFTAGTDGPEIEFFGLGDGDAAVELIREQIKRAD